MRPEPEPPGVDELIEAFNGLIRDRNREAEFRGIWRPRAITVNGSVGVQEAADEAKAFVWAIELPRTGICVLTSTRRAVSTDLTMLTANRGEGARRLLGNVFDIETTDPSEVEPVLDSVAVLDTAETQARIRRHGRLLLPVTA